MNDTFWAMLFRPFLVFFVMVFICLPVRFAAKRWIPEGRLKQFLLMDLKERRARKTQERKLRWARRRHAIAEFIKKAWSQFF